MCCGTLTSGHVTAAALTFIVAVVTCARLDSSNIPAWMGESLVTIPHESWRLPMAADGERAIFLTSVDSLTLPLAVKESLPTLMPVTLVKLSETQTEQRHENRSRTCR